MNRTIQLQIPAALLLLASTSTAQGVPEACLQSIRDQSNGACLQASSDPTLGMLFPMSAECFIDPVTGYVGMGTTNPAQHLQIGEYFSTMDDVYIELRTVGGGLNLKQGLKMRSSNPFFGFDIEHDDTLKGLNFLRQDNDNGAFDDSLLFLHRQNGNVGIGTTAPSKKLDVNGGAAFSGGDGELVQVTQTNDTNGTDALVARNTGTTSAGGSAILGITSSTGNFAVYADGNFAVSGSKAFVQPHPTDASKQVRFYCLEGNESGTYFRGKAQLVGGSAVIEVPEDFRLVTDSENLTVQLTAVGRGDVWVEAYGLEELRIAGERDMEVHYVINGVRRGFGEQPTIEENFAFRPQVAGEAFGSQYPQEIRDMLVENGLLNSDYTPNEATANALGWQLAPSAGSAK